MSNAIINTSEVTINAAQNTKTVPVAAPMRDAIITALNAGNPHAIKASEVQYAGVTPEEFSAWTTWVESLRQACIEYGKVVDDKTSSQEQLDLAKGRVWDKWRTILKAGEEDKFHPNMFTREQDAETVRVYATGITTLTIPGIGSVASVTPANIFRKMIEKFLGLRIRANAALCDADRDTIAKYLGAKASILKAQERLRGQDTDDGHKPGLLENMATLQKRYEDSIALLVSVGIDEDTAKKNPAMVTLTENISTIEAQIKAASKTISEANTFIADNQTQYDRIIATINKIEAGK